MRKTRYVLRCFKENMQIIINQFLGVISYTSHYQMSHLIIFFIYKFYNNSIIHSLTIPSTEICLPSYIAYKEYT